MGKRFTSNQMNYQKVILCAVIDGVVNDIYDGTRGGSRCVYGYWYI